MIARGTETETGNIGVHLLAAAVSKLYTCFTHIVLNRDQAIEPCNLKRFVNAAF